MRSRDSVVVPGATRLFCGAEGVWAEAALARCRKLPTSESTTNLKGHCDSPVAKFSLSLDAALWTRTAKHCNGVWGGDGQKSPQLRRVGLPVVTSLSIGGPRRRIGRCCRGATSIVAVNAGGRGQVHRNSISVVCGTPVFLQPSVDPEIAHCAEFLLGTWSS